MKKLAENLNGATVISRENLTVEAQVQLAATEQAVKTAVLKLDISPVESWFEAKIENLETLFTVSDALHLHCLVAACNATVHVPAQEYQMA